jgi:hypothetical protein
MMKKSQRNKPNASQGTPCLVIFDEFAKLQAKIAAFQPKYIVAYELLSFLPHSLIERIHNECKGNDLAHQPDHVFGVVRQVDRILTTFPQYEHYRKVLLGAALLHDVKCHVNRDIHHVLAAQSVDAYYGNIGVYDIHELELIKLCILEHRASFKGVRTGPITEIMAAADRGIPDVMRFLQRAVLFRISNEGITPDNVTDVIIERQVNSAVEHLIDKYGSNGYAWKNESKFTTWVMRDHIASFIETLTDFTPEVIASGIQRYPGWLKEAYKPTHETPS